MPTYDYRCKDCGTTHEIQHGFNDERPTTCPTCGGRLARVFHPVGVVFKGSGFHKTDYTSTGRRPAPSEAPAKAESAQTKSEPAKSEPSKSEAAGGAKPASAQPAAKSDAKSDPKPSGSA